MGARKLKFGQLSSQKFKKKSKGHNSKSIKYLKKTKNIFRPN